MVRSTPIAIEIDHNLMRPYAETLLEEITRCTWLTFKQGSEAGELKRPIQKLIGRSEFTSPCLLCSRSFSSLAPLGLSFSVSVAGDDVT